jgi:hypothetical protein
VAHAAAELSEIQNGASRFQTWCRSEVLRQVLTDVSSELRDSLRHGQGRRLGDCLKIMAIVDRHGLPLGQHARRKPSEVRLVQLCFDFYMIEDRAYDIDPLDNELRRDDIETIAPHRSNRRSRRHRIAGVPPTELPRLRPTRLPDRSLQTMIGSRRYYILNPAALASL